MSEKPDHDRVTPLKDELTQLKGKLSKEVSSNRELLEAIKKMHEQMEVEAKKVRDLKTELSSRDQALDKFKALTEIHEQLVGQYNTQTGRIEAMDAEMLQLRSANARQKDVIDKKIVSKLVSDSGGGIQQLQ